jgi:hypothetical protein
VRKKERQKHNKYQASVDESAIPPAGQPAESIPTSDARFPQILDLMYAMKHVDMAAFTNPVCLRGRECIQVMQALLRVLKQL